MEERDQQPVLQDGELLAYLEGALDTNAHRRVEFLLAQDQASRVEAETLLSFVQALEQHTSTSHSPSSYSLSSLEIAEYALGLTPPQSMAWIEEQIKADTRLEDELAQARAFLQRVALDADTAAGAGTEVVSTAAPPGWRVIIAQQLDQLGDLLGGLSPATARVRGEPEQGLRLFEAGAAQVVLETHEDPPASGNWTVTGLVLSASPATAVEVTPAAGGPAIAAAQTDAGSNFIIAGLGPARYALSIQFADSEIRIDELTVGL